MLLKIPQFSVLLVLFSTAWVTSSCDDKSEASGKETRFNKDDFFSGAEPTRALNTFKNEIQNAPTDFLNQLKDSSIPWQNWDATLIEKAKAAHSPILLFVGSSIGAESLRVAKEIEENPELYEPIVNKALCAIVDIHANPEIGSLSYRLSSENTRATAFPTIMWLSHEGDPLAWIPIGDLSGRELQIVIRNAAAMVDAIWSSDSAYAVENSRADNEFRQKKLNYPIGKRKEGTKPQERNELFRRYTRQLSSLYSFGDRDLDQIGGLVPTHSLRLLALGSTSGLLTDEVRERCRVASLAVSTELIKEALLDHLDGSYFYARRSTDWSLPTFSKTLSSQMRITQMLISVGSILNEEALLQEGIRCLSHLEKTWLSQPLSMKTPIGDSDEPGRFLWNFEILEEILTEEEMEIAVATFSLKKEGNIPSSVDPLQNYYNLNTLRRNVPLPQLAAKLQMPENGLQQSISSISKKLLAHRDEKNSYSEETSLSVSDLALTLTSQLIRLSHSGLPQDRTKAQDTAQKILNDFMHPEKGLSRFSLKRGFITARCTDFSLVSNAFFLLYQATLDENWLSESKKILDTAIDKLESDLEILAELPKEEQIVPLTQYGRSMIFGESSLGILDQSLNRLFAITGEEKYRNMIIRHTEEISPLAARSPVNHTDFVTSCALGDTPLIAILHGDLTTPVAQELLLTLNSPKALSFLTIRPAQTSGSLAPLPEIVDNSDNITPKVTLVRDNEILGQTSDPSQLMQIISGIISQK